VALVIAPVRGGEPVAATSKRETDGSPALAKLPLGVGRYKVTATKKGFEPAEAEVEVKRGKESVLTLAQKERPGAVRVLTKPAGLQVSLDGTAVGEAPLRKEGVVAGEHEVSVNDAPSGLVVRAKVRVTGDETAVQALDLESPLATLTTRLANAAWTRAEVPADRLRDAVSCLEALTADYGSIPATAWAPPRLAELEDERLWNEFQRDLTAAASTESKVAACERFLAASPRHRRAQEAARLRDAFPWGNETLPEGMRRGREKPVYLWNTGKEGLEIEMVYVPAGEFTMGASEGDLDEQPAHKHRIDCGYFVGRRETTWREFRAFAKAGGRPEPPAPPWGAKDEYPVVNVSWDDAATFCVWAGLALPSEAEWEKAARGPDGRVFPWGSEPPTPERGVFQGSRSPGLGGRCPAGASPCGALDMAGNVWEWCRDAYMGNAYEQYARGDFAEPRGGGALRAVRGGSFKNDATSLKAWHRNWLAPGERSAFVGFRVVKAP
jgi:formylglycine-generating enzyme required for sulfatase activity